MSDGSLACIDWFKTGDCDCGCGCVPCLNNRPPLGPSCPTNPGPVQVSDNKGDCVPLVRDSNHIIVGSCKRPHGGDMTIRAPIFAVTIENPPDNVLRAADGSPILDGNGNIQAVNTQQQHCSTGENICQS